MAAESPATRYRGAVDAWAKHFGLYEGYVSAGEGRPQTRLEVYGSIAFPGTGEVKQFTAIAAALPVSYTHLTLPTILLV